MVAAVVVVVADDIDFAATLVEVVVVPAAVIDDAVAADDTYVVLEVSAGIEIAGDAVNVATTAGQRDAELVTAPQLQRQALAVAVLVLHMYDPVGKCIPVEV